MYQNKVTLLGFLGSNPEVRTANNGQLRDTLAGNQVLLQEGRQVRLAHRMAPLRSLRQALGVRQDAHHRRTHPGGRRAAQPGAREQEDGLEAARLGNSGRFDPEAGPRRKGRAGRSGTRGNVPGGNGRISPCSSLSEARLSAGLSSL
jgi:hypothetical protein